MEKENKKPEGLVTIDNNIIVAVKVSCPLCSKSFPDISKQIFNIAHEYIDILLKKNCLQCGGYINQRYWSIKEADGETRLYIGNRDDTNRPITTLSGILTTGGMLDPQKLKIFKRQGLNMKIFNSLDDRLQKKINAF